MYLFSKSEFYLNNFLINFKQYFLSQNFNLSHTAEYKIYNLKRRTIINKKYVTPLHYNYKIN